MQRGPPTGLTRVRRLGQLEVALAAWLAACAVGFGCLLDYAHTPGAPSVAPARWPAATPWARATDRPTVVVFAHPRCPCTRASLAELARVVGRARRPFALHVVLFVPQPAPADWLATDLVAAAARLPGVALHTDGGGELARRFDARTSGHTLVYDAQGALAYSGGLTAARAHEGDNAGADRVASLLGAPGASGFPLRTFGCPLDERDTAAASPGQEPACPTPR